MAADTIRPSGLVTRVWVRALEQTTAAISQPYSGFALPLDDLAARFSTAPALLSAEKSQLLT